MIALITCEELPDLSEADKLLIPEFKNKGFEAQAVIWTDKAVEWSSFEAIIIRNTWDYFHRRLEFENWIQALLTLKVPIFNEPQIILKNLHKFYLRDFENSGIVIIPTGFISNNDTFDNLENWSKVVLKPAVSAGSEDTHLIDLKKTNNLNELIKVGEWLIQPFLEEIKQGEISLVFFNKKYEYSIIKRPKTGDFRVQKQFGGEYLEYEPSAKTIATAQYIIDKISEDLLFARVDGVLVNDDFLLMELELIEPDLYFDIIDGAASLFVNSVLSKII